MSATLDLDLDTLTLASAIALYARMIDPAAVTG